MKLPNWPALMDEETAAAYLGVGAVSFRAIAGKAGARPVELGLRLLRWRKADLDRLVEGLPLKGEMAGSCLGAETAIDLALDAVVRKSTAAGRQRRASRK